MTQRQQRTLRGFLAAALAVFVAALFHIAGGGSTPTPLALVASTILATPFCVLLAGRRSALLRLGLSVALGQVAFHLLFGLGQPSDVRFSGGGMPGMAGMQLHVSGAAGGASVSLAVPAMWAAHAAAAVVTIAAIRHGEQLLRRMLELAARFLIRAVLLAVLPFPERRAAAATAAQQPVLAHQFLAGALRRRGPPVEFAL